MPNPNTPAAALDTALADLGRTLDSYPTPQEALQALIAWHVDVALDPAVSERAQALVKSGRASVEPWPYVEDYRMTADRLARACDELGFPVLVDAMERAVHKVFIERPSRLAEIKRLDRAGGIGAAKEKA